MNESQAVTYKTLIKDASYGEAGPDERTIAAYLDLFNRLKLTEDLCGGAIEVKLSDAKADDGARNLKALERKVLSNPAAQNAAPAFLAVVVGKGSIAYTRDDGVAVIPMAALGA